MDLKPGDLFLGVVDFLAVLVPGSVLVFALRPYAPLIFGPDRLFPPITDTETRWAVFIITAYVTGHLIASVASYLLDCIYDSTYRNYRRLLKKPASGGVLAKLRAYGTAIKEAWKRKDKTPSDPLLTASRALRTKQIQSLALGDSSSGVDEQSLVMWAQSDVAVRSSAAAAEIERYQANSKLFRSMTVVLILLIPLTVSRDTSSSAPWSRILVLLFLAILFCHRFMQLRWQATERTYEYFLLLTLVQEPPANGKPKSTET